MTREAVNAAKKRIEKCKQANNHLEALIRLQHLNRSLLLFILSAAVEDTKLKNLKSKQILDLLSEELEHNTALKTLINKKNSKPVKIWFKQMDAFMKALKTKWPAKQSELLQSGEAVFLLLHLSASKAFPANTAAK